MTISLDSLTSNPVGTENGLITRNIPSGIQTVEITDGYGDVLGTSDNPLVTTSQSSTRTTCTFVAFNFSGVSGESMITFIPYKNYVAGTAAASFTVDAGTTLKIQNIIVDGVNAGSSFRLRISNSGTVTTSTPVIIPFTTNTNTPVSISIPEGLELSGSMQFGVSQYNTGTGQTYSITIIGYEY